MSTLRETLHRLVDSVTAWGARERVAIPSDVTGALCDAARALESETRTKVDSEAFHGLVSALVPAPPAALRRDEPAPPPPDLQVGVGYESDPAALRPSENKEDPTP